MRNQMRTMSLLLSVALVSVVGCDDEPVENTPDANMSQDAAGGSDARGGSQGGSDASMTADGSAPDGGVMPSDGGGGADGGGADAATVPTVLALSGTATTSVLTTFAANAPQTVSAPVAITGLEATEVILNITVRPANGKIYGLGSTSRLYEINRTTGAATAIGTAAFTPALMGTYYGFDFNPTVDRIRLISDAEQNLRLHPDTGVVAGTDTALAPAGSVGAVAYTNSFAGATMTTVFGLDYASNNLVRMGGPDSMPSPNLGAITVIGPVGSDIGEPASLDIAPNNVAYGAWQSAGATKFYTLNLTTGAASEVGTIGGTTAATMVRSIAVLQ